jgi:HlyD family secretion protein
VIKLGDKALFTVEFFANHPFSGEIVQIRQSPQTIQNVVTYDAVIGTSNKDGLLKPGMTANAQIVVDRREDVLLLPDQALRYLPTPLIMQGTSGALAPLAPGEGRVWVSRDGQAKPVTVALGLDDDTSTEVVKGDLRSGDEVIIGEDAGAPRSPKPSSAPRF